MSEWIFVAAAQSGPVELGGIAWGICLAIVVVIACVIWERFDR